MRFRNLHVQISRIVLKPNKNHTNRIIQIVPCKTAFKRLHHDLIKQPDHERLVKSDQLNRDKLI